MEDVAHHCTDPENMPNATDSCLQFEVDWNVRFLDARGHRQSATIRRVALTEIDTQDLINRFMLDGEYPCVYKGLSLLALSFLFAFSLSLSLACLS